MYGYMYGNDRRQRGNPPTSNRRTAGNRWPISRRSLCVLLLVIICERLSFECPRKKDTSRGERATGKRKSNYRTTFGDAATMLPFHTFFLSTLVCLSNESRCSQIARSSAFSGRFNSFTNRVEFELELSIRLLNEPSSNTTKLGLTHLLIEPSSSSSFGFVYKMSQA